MHTPHLPQAQLQGEGQQRTDRLLQELRAQQQWDAVGVHAWLRAELDLQARPLDSSS